MSATAVHAGRACRALRRRSRVIRRDQTRSDLVDETFELTIGIERPAPLTDQHFDRLADRVLPAGLRDVLSIVLDKLLTPDVFNQVHEELLDPFAGQALPRVPAPCEGRDATVLTALRAIQVTHDAEPFLIGDSEAATERDLAYRDRIIDALDLAAKVVAVAARAMAPL